MYRVAPISTRNQFGPLLNERGLAGTAVEIGTHRGDFAKILLASWTGQRLYCVDPWLVPDGYQEQADLLWGGAKDRSQDMLEAQATLAQFGDRARLVRGLSSDAAGDVRDGTVDFVYVDGDHRFRHVLNDLIEWWPKLRGGGILAGHDWAQPGEAHRWADEIQRAVAEFKRQFSLDVFLVVEEAGLPWSYWMEKP